MAPESANRFYWKKVHTIPKPEINGESMLKHISEIVLNFPGYRDEMIAEVENYSVNTVNNTAYVKRTYCGGKCKKMNPKSFCVIRMSHLIDKKTLIGMDREVLLNRIIQVSKAFKKVIRFANRQD